MQPLRQIIKIFADALGAWSANQGPRQAAAMAYFTIFTLAPLLVVITTFVGVFLGEDRVRADITAELTSSFGPDAAELINTLIANVVHPAQGLISSLISIVIVLFGAIALFEHLQGSMNMIWKVPQPTSRSEGIVRFLRGKLIGLAMVMIAGALIVLSVVFSTMMAVWGRQILDPLPGTEAIYQTTNFLLNYGASTLLFAMIFKLLPNAKTYWIDSLIGAAITTLLFSFGRAALAWYFANAAPSSAYGAAGSLVAVMLWANYSAQIILYGAEFTHAFARARERQNGPPPPEEEPVDL